MVNNHFVIFQIDCHLAKKETTDDREFDLAIDPDGTFADFETGFVLAGSTCTLFRQTPSPTLALWKRPES